LRRYLAREIYLATALVLAALLALFIFFDLINELEDLGKGDYALRHVFAYVLLAIPARVYEVFPIAVLIGTLYALDQLARHSEITVMRGSGLSTWALVAILAQAGALFVVIAFLLGEYVAPPAERLANRLRVEAQSRVIGQEFRSGLWVKDERTFINVRTVLPDTSLRGIRIYELDPDFSLRAISEAHSGQFLPPDSWRLTDVVRTSLGEDRTTVERLPELIWHSALNPDILGVLLVSPERMSLAHLRTYIDHLNDNRQDSSRYRIAFWKKLIYPAAAWVMLILSVPFAWRQQRLGGAGVRIFAGVMIGIGFHMLNGLFSNLGVINAWPPIVAAAAPSLLFLAAAGGLLWWTERA
jgi:lipopolysaccharide export system permease protein